MPKNTSIGKRSEEEPDMMYPNSNFLKFFPESEIPETREPAYRSGCLRIGTFLVIRKIISEQHLDELMFNIFGQDSGLFLDLAAYTIITENNAGQYYPDYAYNHPLLTYGMKVYSDSKISDFISSITRDQSISFQNGWNDRSDHSQKIYISYDSTNKNCSAGDLVLVETGHPKDDQGKPILNYSIAYDRDNSLPSGMRKYYRTSNHFERLNKELKQKSRVTGIFPNERSLIRLMWSILMELNEAYAVRKAVFGKAAYQQLISSDIRSELKVIADNQRGMLAA